MNRATAIRLILCIVTARTACGCGEREFGPATRVSDALRMAEERTKELPNDPASYVALSRAYLRAFRESGDVSLVTRADAACRKARELAPTNYAALSLQPAICNVQHRFAEAITLARAAIKLSPNDAFNFGTLGDALLETGDYDGAVEAFNTMARLRPDSGSYARIARLHELHGDVDGAIDAMKDSLHSAAGADVEHRAWCHTQLANLYFEHGRFGEAEPLYVTALEIFPKYPFALTNLGRLRSALGRHEEALVLYQKSMEIAPRQETVALLVDVLEHLHRKDEARDAAEMMIAIDKLMRAANVLPNRTAVLFWCDRGERLGESLEQAQASARERRDIFTMDALAWALYSNGRFAEALEASRQSLRLGTRDAVLLYHQGMIQLRLENKPEAADALRRALAINPQFHIRFADQARAALLELETKR